jgi:DNA-binding response OmpR family regulator
VDPKSAPHVEAADHPARILIVDDDENSRQLLQVMLSREGFELQAAAGGEEALALVARQPPDLILLDVTMPGMDGYKVAARIKGDLHIQSIPIILITALDSRNARMLGLGAGADDFLGKPVDRAELCVRVRHLLSLTYGNRYDQQGPRPSVAVAGASKELPDGRPETEGAAREAARLIAALSPAWQEAVLRIIQEVHGQIVAAGRPPR